MIKVCIVTKNRNCSCDIEATEKCSKGRKSGDVMNMEFRCEFRKIDDTCVIDHFFDGDTGDFLLPTI